jgi:hypothetical protein
MSYTLKEVEQKHTAYDKHIDEWRFFNDSFLGGESYKQGGYLTRYESEIDNDDSYQARLKQTPIDNHCASIIQIYSSFLFRENATRNFGSLTDNEFLKLFIKDSDTEGRAWNNFVKQANEQASVYGHCWVVLDRPNIQYKTKAEELDANVRPYVSMFTAPNVIDWKYEYSNNGLIELSELKVVEASNTDFTVYKWFFRDRTDTIAINKKGGKQEVQLLKSVPNTYGKITAVALYARRSNVLGLGYSDVGDIATQQKAIYNERSEIEQAIRLNVHSILASEHGVQVGPGAGGRCVIPENTEPGLKPYFLDSNSDIAVIMNSIEHKVDAINVMANVGSVRAIESKKLSGVALETEFQLLNARLAEKADNLELFEEQIFKMFSMMVSVQYDGEINYPDSFNIRDKYVDLNFLQQAKLSNVNSDVFNKQIDKQIVNLTIKQESLLAEVLQEIDNNDVISTLTNTSSTNT